MPCSHTTWLHLSEKNHEVTLQVSDRPKRLLQALGEKKSEAFPFVLLIGNQTKAEAVRRLGVNLRNERGQRGHGDVHLFEAPQGNLSAPAIVAETDIPRHNRMQCRMALARCHDTAAYALTSKEVYRRKADYYTNILCHRLLLPFVDVVCLFVDDLGGLNMAAHRVAMWLNQGRVSNGLVSPWLLLVTQQEEICLEEFASCVRAKTNVNISKSFQGVRSISLSARQGLRQKKRYQYRQWNTLERELSSLIDCAREDRVIKRYLFSAQHLIAFLCHATTGISSDLSPFDFLAASRSRHQVSCDLELHLSDFLNRVSSFEDFKSFAVPLIASSIMLDHYSPRMHCFDPYEVFAALYQTSCVAACRRTFQSQNGTNYLVLPSTFALLMRAELQHQFQAYLEGGSAASLHQLRLHSFRFKSISLYSSDTCFSCMMKRPKFKLPCEHWICEPCARKFGSKRGVLLYLKTCLLCGASGVRLRIKPDTASVRVLSIDGGGTRACVPLKFLQELQKRIGLPYPVQNNFDVLFGTSSGAISICGLGVNGWTVDDCTVRSRGLARQVFRPRQVAQFPFAWIPHVKRFWQVVMSVLLDSRYPSQNMEAALKKVFGSSRKICDWSPGTEMGFHIGMPVTSTDDASTYLITNYNGAGKRAEDSDYYILRALDEGGDVPLWQALRATTAAPYFFAPQEIEGKTYQDGGIVEYNNPAALACAETAVIFPETPLPSIVASFGTGSAGPKRETMASRSLKSKGQLGTRRVTKSRKQVRGRKLSDRFASRIFQAFLSQGDSNRAWKQLLSKREVHGSGGFFRFDVQYEGSVPSLDSIADLDEMEEIAEECITTSPALDKLALCLRAHNFYFELDKEPEYVDGQYECTGNIYCLLESDSEEREVFFSSLHHSSSVFQVCSRTVPGDFLASTDTRLDDEFSRNIKFSVPERQTPFEITLKEGAEDACGISGSPFTIDQLVKVQKLDAWFGTGDHRQ